MVVARYGDSTAFISTETYDRASESVSIYAYTDRPVYRPGHTVFFKGIVRKFTGDAYKAPQQGEARVEVRDRRGSQVYVGTIPLSKFGSFHGEFKLPEFAATGYYDLTCSFNGEEQTANFTVAEYKKPEFTVSVETPKKRCVKGEKVKAKIRASYFFGAPVAGAEVRYVVSRSDYWFWPDEEEDYQEYGGEYDYGYEDYGGYGESYREGTVRTGDDGTAEIEFVADWNAPRDQYYQNDQQYSIYAYVTDQSSREAEGQGSIIATNGAFRLGVDSKQYVVEPGKTSLFTINAVDYDHKPQKGVTVKVTANLAEWSRNKEYYSQTAESTVKTDSAGRASFSFRPPTSGSYVVRASCLDASGNEIRGSSWLWVSGGEARGYDYPDLQLVLDKKSYNPGDTAKLLINSDKQGATALLTIEGRRLYDYKLVKLASKSTLVDIPIKGAYRPNFYVSVCYVQDKKFISQEARAKVSLNEQSLKLTVTPDKRKYEPGDQASYLVKAVDSKGKPVQAEVSLGIVDEAIYDIMEDDTTPIRDFFYARVPNSIYTRYSFPEVYLSGDKAGFTGKVRKEFVDTAFWKADVVTDANGQARVSLKLPDNLTSWRATARGCTMDTTVGQCRFNVTVSKKLLVRLQTPRFLVQRDEAVLTAMVHNYLPESQQVKVTLDAEGLSMTDPASQTVTVDSQGVQPVRWHVKAGGVGQAKLTAYAVAPKAQDAMEMSIPVRPHGFRLVQNKTGMVSEGVAEEKITLSKRRGCRGDADTREACAIPCLCDAGEPRLPGGVPLRLHRADDEHLPAGCGHLAHAEDTEHQQPRPGKTPARYGRQGAEPALRLPEPRRRLGMVRVRQ